MKRHIKVPTERNGYLDTEALFRLSIEEQRALLSALNKTHGPWNYEQLVAEEAVVREKLRCFPMAMQDAAFRQWECDVWVPRCAQRKLAVELQLLGAVAGRTKGASVTKKAGADTAARISNLVRQIGKPPNTRGLAGRIAKLALVDRSTVARHLRTLAK
jgi:hypothetical protein